MSISIGICLNVGISAPTIELIDPPKYSGLVKTWSISVIQRLPTDVAVDLCNTETSQGDYPYPLSAKQIEIMSLEHIMWSILAEHSKIKNIASCPWTSILEESSLPDRVLSKYYHLCCAEIKFVSCFRHKPIRHFCGGDLTIVRKWCSLGLSPLYSDLLLLVPALLAGSTRCV